MKNRKEIIEERLLRDNIRKIIKKNLANMKKEDSLQEQKLRNSIRNIILEKVAVPDKVPHPITGINVLEDLLKKVVPVILSDYSRMTTNPEQKRAQVNKIVNKYEYTLTQNTLQSLSLQWS